MYFVPETKKTVEVLEEFLARRLSIAAVVDEFGGTAGIVTMEEEIVVTENGYEYLSHPQKSLWIIK